MGGLLAPGLRCPVPLCPFERCCVLAPLPPQPLLFVRLCCPSGGAGGLDRKGGHLPTLRSDGTAPQQGTAGPAARPQRWARGHGFPRGNPPPLTCGAYPPGQGRHMLRRPWPAPLDIPKNVNSQTVKHPAPGLVCQGIQGAKRRGKMPRRPYLDTIETPTAFYPRKNHNNYSFLGLKKAPSDGMI